MSMSSNMSTEELANINENLTKEISTRISL